MPMPRIYKTVADRQAAYRARKSEDNNKDRSWARRYLIERGHDTQQMRCVYQWSSGKTLWIDKDTDGVSYICDPTEGSIRKQRSG